MFIELSTLALVLPLVAGLTINAPSDPVVSGGSVTLTWTASTTDPGSFSIELVNQAFHNTYAIANNVPTANGQITLTLPSVPTVDGYSIEAIANNDINTVYSQTGQFSIGSASGSTTIPGSTTTGASTTASATLSTPSTTATSPTVSVSSTASSASVSVPSTSGTSTGSSTPSPSTFSSGAASFKMDGIIPAAALVLSVVAGAAMVF